MKKKMSAKNPRILFLVTGILWTASTALHLWWMITRWDVYGADSVMELRGLTLVLSLICVVLNFVNFFRWKAKE